MTDYNLQSSEPFAGVDEAGRGPLAGPVVAAAVILSPDQPITGIDDSKKLSAKKREQLAVEIKANALCWSISSVSPAEIDQLNILHATMKAMAQALDGLTMQPEYALIDGNRCPENLLKPIPMSAVIGGDKLHECIGAASILAKVHRDQYMVELDARYPEYGFAKHKGYPTAQHIEALNSHGPTRHHRNSFRPVREARTTQSASSQQALSKRRQAEPVDG